jgi:hypothetical protein
MNNVCECHQCIVMSIAFLVIGLILGMLLQKHGTNLRLEPRPSTQSESLYASHLNPEHEPTVDPKRAETVESIETLAVSDEEFDYKHAWRRRGSQSSQYSHSSIVVNFTKSMLSLRGTLFANSMRKLSTMSGRQHGLIEARGKVRVNSITLAKSKHHGFIPCSIDSRNWKSYLSTLLCTRCSAGHPRHRTPFIPCRRLCTICCPWTSAASTAGLSRTTVTYQRTKSSRRP